MTKVEHSQNHVRSPLNKDVPVGTPGPDDKKIAEKLKGYYYDSKLFIFDDGEYEPLEPLFIKKNSHFFSILRSDYGRGISIVCWSK